MSRILRAHPNSRRWAVRAVALGTVIGAVGVTWISIRMQRLEELARESPTAAGLAAAALYELLIGASVLATCTAAFFVLRRSVLGLRHGEYPPPGTRVLRDTRVLTGPAARSVASLGIVLATLLLGCAAALLVLLSRLELCLGRITGS